MMKTTSICYLLVGVSVVLSYHVDDLHLEWTNFKQTYNRQYSSHEEEMMKKNAFERNMKMVEMHNLMYHRGLKSYKMAFNKFSDMTPDEISSMNSFKIPSDNKGMGSKFLSPLNLAELPKEVDWRVKGLVTKPRDQGACQSCYAFSVVGAVEGQHARKTGKLVKLSEQNLVDCSTTYGNLACQGGYMEATFKYVVDHGIDTEESYPYIDGEQDCKFRNDSVVAKITGYKYIEQGNEQQLLEAVATVGPISAAIHAPLSLIYYSGGVYDSSDCNPKKLCHAVLVVGYGTENGKDYWIVKNSIGEYWGDKGYFKLLRNKNQCGIAEHAWFPTV